MEEIIPENLLSEPPKTDNPITCSEVPDDGLLPDDPAGQEVTWTISRASSTLEGDLAHEDALALNAADPSHPAPLDMAEGSSALDVATTEGPAPEGGAGSDQVPEVVGGKLLFFCLHGRPCWIVASPI